MTVAAPIAPVTAKKTVAAPIAPVLAKKTVVAPIAPVTTKKTVAAPVAPIPKKNAKKPTVAPKSKKLTSLFKALAKVNSSIKKHCSADKPSKRSNLSDDDLEDYDRRRRLIADHSTHRIHRRF